MKYSLAIFQNGTLRGIALLLFFFTCALRHARILFIIFSIIYHCACCCCSLARELIIWGAESRSSYACIAWWYSTPASTTAVLAPCPCCCFVPFVICSLHSLIVLSAIWNCCLPWNLKQRSLLFDWWVDIIEMTCFGFLLCCHTGGWSKGLPLFCCYMLGPQPLLRVLT